MLSEQLEDRRLLAAVSWDGGGDGTSWNDADNWDTNTIPTIADDVTIDVAGEAEITIQGSGAEANSLQAAETIRMNGNLTLVDDSEFSGTFLAGSGSLSGAGDIVFSGTAGIGGSARIDGTGTLFVAPGTSLGVQTPSFSRIVDNAGIINVVPGSGTDITTTFRNDLINRATGEIRLNAGAELSMESDDTFFNQGLLSKTGEATSFLSANLTNTGTIDIGQGELRISGNGSTSTDISVDAGETLRLSGSFSFGDDTVTSGAGQFGFYGSGPYDFSQSEFLPTGPLDFNSVQATIIINNTLPSTVTFPTPVRSSFQFGADQTLHSPGFQFGTISGSGNVTLTGNASLNRSTFVGGSLLVTPDATVSVFDRATFRRPVEIAGELIHRGDFIRIESDFDVLASGRFEVRDEADIDFSVPGRIENFGSFVKTGVGTTDLGINGEFHNHGELRIEEGTLEVILPIQTSTSIDVPAGATLHLFDPIIFEPGLTFSGAGEIIFQHSGGEIQDLNEVQFLPTGNVTITRDIIIGNTLPAEVSLAPLTGNLTFNADQTFNSISSRNVVFDGTGDLSFALSNTFDRTTFAGTGEVLFAPGADNRFIQSITLNQLITNEGSLTVANDTTVRLGDAVTLTNAPEGEIFLEGDVVITGGAATNTLVVNDGLLVSQGARSNRFFGSASASFDNRGTVRVSGTELNFGIPVQASRGTFSVSAGSQIRQSVSTGLVLTEGGRLTGDGQFVGNLINGGIVAPGTETGVLTIVGDYTQTSTGTLQVDIEGVATGLHDVLNVTGTATLDGDLATNLSPSFNAEADQSFDVLTATAVSGSLTDDLPPGLSAQVTDTAVRLTVVPSNDANVLRDSVNRSFEDVRPLLGSLGESHSDAAESVPMLPAGGGTINDAWGLAEELNTFGQTTLTEITSETPTLEDLRTSLESLGLTVDCVGDCDQDDLLRFSYQPDPVTVATPLESGSLGQTSLAAVGEGVDFDGLIELTATIRPEFDFVFDEGGFYLTPDSRLQIEFGVEANVSADVSAFSALVDSQFQFASLITLDSLDQNSDQRVTPAEWAIGLTEVSVDYSVGGGSASIDLVLAALDYVDVLATEENSANGGDPFRFRASSTLNPSEPNDSALEFSWAGVEIANPDTDNDGQDDFTSDVLVENVRLLIQDVVRGGQTDLVQQLELGLADESLVTTDGSFGDATNLAAALADYLAANTQILDVVDFETVETWLNSGVPTERDEIIRLQVELEEIPLPVENSISVNLNQLLPGLDLTGATAGLGNANIGGQLVFGLDTSTDPFYLLVAGDDVSPDQYSELEASIDLTGSAETVRIGGDLLELTDVAALIRPTATFTFDAGGEAKLRLSELGTSGISVAAGASGASETMLASQQLRLFPDDDGTQFHASADLVRGSIDRDTLATQLTAARVSVGVGRSIEVVSNDISLEYDPTITADNATFATIGSSTLRFPEYPNLPSVGVDGLTIRRDGFSIDSFTTQVAESNPTATALSQLAAAEAEGDLTIRGRVWLDRDGDNTATDEFGVGGQIVRLYGSDDGDNPISQTVSDESGQYEFTVDPGIYFVEFELTSDSTTFVSAGQGSESIDSDVVSDGRTASITVTLSDKTNLSDAGIRNKIERPVLIVPGIVGTFAKDVASGSNYKDWLLHRGIHPDQIESDPLTRVYDDLVQTLDNVGYTPNEDLFVVTYDWRVLPGPEDGTIDGQIDGLSAQDLVDETFTFGADYLGYFLDKAAKRWEANHPGEILDRVDIIAHSTGGLVTRAYLQSSAHGEQYTRSDNVVRNLPEINHLFSMGVPHRGASKAWNPLHNNVKTDASFRVVVSKVINAALEKLKQTGVILGPSGSPTAEDAILLTELEQMPGDLETNFTREYVPTTRALLATFDFLTDENGDLVDVNGSTTHSKVRNSLALDLNAGLDHQLVGDPNAFVDRLKGNLVVIAGTSEETLRRVRSHRGEDLIDEDFPTSHQRNPNPYEIVGISDFLARPANPNELWYQDISEPNGGDGTVPIVSSLGQFQTDVARIASGKIILAPLVREEATAPNGDVIELEPKPGHLPLMHIPRSQRTVLAGLGHVFAEEMISQGKVVSAAENALAFVPLLIATDISGVREFKNIATLLLDPIGTILIDGNGDRILGYDANLDQVIEVEGTTYIGGADGLGFVYGDFEGPFSVEVTGVPGDGEYYIQGDFSGTRIGGFEDAGVLATGQQLTLDIPTVDQFPSFGISDLLDVAGLTITGNGINVTVGESASTIEGTITVTADQAALLPDQTTEQIDGLITIAGFTGNLDLATGALSLSANEAELLIQDVVTVSASSDGDLPGIAFAFDPTNTDPDAQIATINNLDFEFPALADIDPGQLKVESIAINRSGFDLVTEFGGDGLSGSFGQSPQLLDFDGLNIQSDLRVRIANEPSGFLNSFVVTGSIGLTADSATLFPESPITLAITDDNPADERPGVSGRLDLETGKFGFELRRLQTSLGGVIDVQVESLGDTPAISFEFDPNAGPTDELIRFAALDASIPALEFEGQVPAVQLNGFGFQNNGTPQIDSASVDLPGGSLGQLPIGNLLPFEFDSLSLSFPDANDLNSPVVGVEGEFQLDELQSGLQSFLGDSVTPTVTVGTDAPGSLAFELAIDSLVDGEIRPLNFGPITVGLAGLEVGSLTLDGSLIWGGLVNGVIQSDVSGSFDFVTSDPADPFAGLSVDILSGSSIVTTADGLIVDVGARITFDGDFTGQIGGVDVAGTSVDLAFLLETSAIGTVPFIQVERASIEFVALTIDEIDFEIDGFLRVFSTDLSIFNPSPADGQIADVENVTIDFLGAFDSLGTGAVDGLRLFEDRVEFDNGSISIPGTIGDGSIFGFTNLELFTSDFVFDFDSGAIGAGAIGLMADEATLLGEATITSPRLAVDLNTTEFEFNANGLAAGYGDLIEFETGPLDVTVSDSAAVIASVVAATITLPRIKDDEDQPLTFDIEGTEQAPGLTIRRDGFDIASLTHSPFDFAIDGIVELKQLQVGLTDVSFDTDSGFRSGASVAVTANEADLLTGLPALHASVRGFQTQIDINSGSSVTEVDSIDLGFGGDGFEDALLILSGSDVALNLDGSNRLLTVGSATAKLPTAPFPELRDFEASAQNFGIERRDGDLQFVRDPGFGVSFAGPEFDEVLSDSGVPDIIDIDSFGFQSGDDFANDPTDFVLTVSAAIKLKEPIPVTAAIDNLTIDVGRLADGELLDALDFDNITAQIGPIEFGSALTISGGLSIGNLAFDNPNIPGGGPNQPDDELLFLGIQADVVVGGLKSENGSGFNGTVLITEHGPIAIDVGFQAEIPIGATGVSIQRGGGSIVFGAEPFAVPADPLDLLREGSEVDFRGKIEGFKDDDGNTDLNLIREFTRGVFQNPANYNAGSIIPRPTWENPLLATIDVGLGPTGFSAAPGVPSPFGVDVTLGMFFDPLQSLPTIQIAGLGTASAGGVELGEIGALIDLTNVAEPEFVLALQTPSANSELTELVPANILFGASFRVEGDQLRLDVRGEVNVLDVLEAEANGTLIIDDDGLFGQLIVTATVDPANTEIDFSSLGVPDVRLSGHFELMFNLTDSPKLIAPVVPNQEGDLVAQEIPAATTRIYVGGILEAGGFEVEGAFLLQNDPDELLVSASGEINLGDLGRVGAEGGISFVKERRGSGGALEQAAGAAGFIGISVEFDSPIIDIEGGAVFQFNTLERDIPIEVPQSGGSSRVETVDAGPYFRVLIADSDLTETGRAKLSIFPSDGDDRPFGIDVDGRFELVIRDELIGNGKTVDLHLEGGGGVIVAGVELIRVDLEANLFLSHDLIYGDFSGDLTSLFGVPTDASINADLDRFGCLHVGGIGDFGFPGACTQRIFIDDHTFDEDSGDQQILVQLTTPAIERMRVTYLSRDAGVLRAQEGVHYELLADEIFIEQGSRTGQIPIRLIDNPDPGSDRGVKFRPIGRYQNGNNNHPSTEEIGTLLILDDDTPPTGPPVEVSVDLLNSDVDGNVLESDRFLKLRVHADQLQSVDALSLLVTVRRTSSASELVSDDFGGDDANAFRARFPIEIQGSRPHLIDIPLIDDDIAEIREEFEIEYSLIREARFAPSTSIVSDPLPFKIRNDDPERPDDAILFYSFDGDANANPLDGTADYDFRNAADFESDRVVGSPIKSATGSVLAGIGVEKLEPLAFFDDQTPGASRNGWTTPSSQRSKLTNGNAANQLDGWRLAKGNWSTALVSTFDRAFVTQSSLLTNEFRLEQFVALDDIANRINAGRQTFTLSGNIRAGNGATGRLEVNFLDASNRSVGLIASDDVSGGRGGRNVDLTDSVPRDAVTAVVRLVAENAGSSPVVFDDIVLTTAEPSYFEFDVRLNDADAPITPDNVDQLLAIHLTGIEFWDRADLLGPRGWELRWSDDGFDSVLASGQTNRFSEARYQPRSEFDVRAIRPIDDPVTFRLYGFGADANSALWSIDNLAMIGTVDTINKVPFPPVAVSDEFLLLSRDADTGITLDVGGNDFDPNGDGRRIIDVSQPAAGILRIASDSAGLSARNVIYTRTNPNATADSFTYTIIDRTGDNSGTSTATVNLQFIDPPPVSQHQYLAVAGEKLDVDAAQGLLRKHDFNRFPSARVELVTQPSLVDDFELNDDGSFALTPLDGLSIGRAFLFTYQIVIDHPLLDGEVVRSLVGQVRIQIDNADARQAIDDVFAIGEDGKLIDNVLDNDAQGFGDPLRAILVSPPRAGSGSEFVLNANGDFTYRPPRNFFGTTSFSYAIGEKPETSEPLEIAAVTIHVSSVNDKPTALSRTITIPGDQKTSQSFTVTGTDGNETAASKLTASISKPAKLGKIVQSSTKSRTLIYTPPVGGLGSRTDSFTFVVIDEQGAKSTAKTVTVKGDGKSSGKTSKGKGSNSHIDGGVVWLEVNGSGQWDAVTFNTLEQLEPSTTTLADGSYVLSIPDPFDPNDNGLIDADEGRLYLNGGTVVATDTPIRYPLKAHGDSEFITPLTTLLVSLTDVVGLPRHNAELRLSEAFNFPAIDLLRTDTLQSTLDGQSNSLLAYVSGVQVTDTVTTIARAVDGVPLDQSANHVYAVLAEMIANDSQDFDLTDEATVDRIFTEVNGRTGNSIEPSTQTALALVIAEINRRMSELQPIAGREVLEQIAKIEKVVQSDLFSAVGALLATELSSQELTERFTGDALAEKIDVASIGNVRIPELSVDDVVVDTTTDSVMFVIRLSEASTQPTTTEFTTVDETLVAEHGDYTSTSGTLTFAAGQIEQQVHVPISGEFGTLSLLLTNAEGATLFDALGTVAILPPSGDSDAVADSVEFAAPNDGDANDDGTFDMQQNNVASFVDIATGSYVTAVSDNGLFTTASTTLPPANVIPKGAILGFDALDLVFEKNSEPTVIDILFEQPIAADRILAAIGGDRTTNTYTDFAFDGRRGAQRFDIDNDGFVEAIRVHLDGQDASLTEQGSSQFAIRLLPIIDLPVDLQTVQIIGTQRPDIVRLRWNESAQSVTALLNGQVIASLPRDEIDRIDIQTLGGRDKIFADRDLPVPLFIEAGQGSDLVYAGAGADQIFGGQGRDKIFSRGGNDAIDGGQNSDLIVAGDGDDQVTAGDGQDVVFGGDGDDTIDGGDGRDVVSGQGGNDTIDGGDAADQLFGGDGNDSLSGGSGRDAIFGGDDDDDLRGGDDDDTIFSGAGNDLLQGDAGDDLLVGGRDVDRILGGSGDDKIYGNSGDDVIFAGSGNDFARGGFGNDLIYGEEGDDRLRGNQGDDKLVGGPGQDSLIGGPGDDELIPGEAIDVAATVPANSIAASDEALYARDVNGDGRISALDALIVINRLARAGEASIELNTVVDKKYDSNGDDRVSASDALLIINHLGQSQPHGSSDRALIDSLETTANEIAPASLVHASDELTQTADDLAHALQSDPADHESTIDQLITELDLMLD